MVLHNVPRCQLTYYGQAETNAEAWFSIALRPRKPEGSLGRTAQDGYLDSHTAPELCFTPSQPVRLYQGDSGVDTGGYVKLKTVTEPSYTCPLKFSSVLLKMVWYLRAQKSPYTLHHVSQKLHFK